MSSEEKEIFRLTKQMQLKEEEFKRQRTLLMQKIELLSSQVAEYQEKQFKNKQLNESIILTYRQNESFRDQLNQRELDSITQQHNNQIASIKQKHQEEKKQYEEQLQLVRAENERLRLEADKSQLEHEKAIAEVRREQEEKQIEQQNDLNLLFSHKMALLAEKLKQAEEMAQMYKDQLESQLRQSYQSHYQSQQNYPNQDNIKPRKAQTIEYKQKTQTVDYRHSESNLSVLQMRINRALVQLNPKQANLEQRIRQIKFKIY